MVPTSTRTAVDGKALFLSNTFSLLNHCYYFPSRFAFERYEEAMNIYFWPRKGSNVPFDVKFPAKVVNPRAWVIISKFPLCLSQPNTYPFLGPSYGQLPQQAV